MLKPSFLMEIIRCQKNYTLGSRADFSGLLLGLLFTAQMLARRSEPDARPGL